MSAKQMKVEVIHPSYDDHKLGDVLTVTAEQLQKSERLRACTRPYEEKAREEKDLTQKKIAGDGKGTPAADNKNQQ